MRRGVGEEGFVCEWVLSVGLGIEDGAGGDETRGFPFHRVGAPVSWMCVESGKGAVNGCESRDNVGFVIDDEGLWGGVGGFDELGEGVTDAERFHLGFVSQLELG